VSCHSSVDSQAFNRICSASKSNQLCVTQILSSIESATGTLTIYKFHQIVMAIASGQAVPELSGVNLCTACTKQIYNILKADFPVIFGSGDITTHLQAACGASFVGKSTGPQYMIQ